MGFIKKNLAPPPRYAPEGVGGVIFSGMGEGYVPTLPVVPSFLLQVNNGILTCSYSCSHPRCAVPRFVHGILRLQPLGRRNEVY